MTEFDDEAIGLFYLQEQESERESDEGAAIVRNIASFLTLSDAASSASGLDIDALSTDSWGNSPLGALPRWTNLQTPPTPALVAVSPNPDQEFDDDDESLGDMMERRRRFWAQEKLAAAVFSHPRSLRSYCLDAYNAAKEVKKTQCRPGPSFGDEDPPETLVEPCKSKRRRRGDSERRVVLIHALVDHILNNVPLSVALDILVGVRELTLDTSFAVVRIASMTAHGILDALVNFLLDIWVVDRKPIQINTHISK